MAEPNDGVPAVAERPVQTPQQDGGELADHNVLENPVPLGEEAHGRLSGNRYRLKGPVFTGNENVKQFIQEFSDVVAVTQWPPHVALLQLRLALTDKAKPYGLGPDVDGIFAALQTQFGLSAVDA